MDQQCEVDTTRKIGEPSQKLNQLCIPSAQAEITIREVNSLESK